MNVKFPLLALAGGGILIFLDQTLKFWAHGHQTYAAYVFRPWFGWEYYANPGVAFNIPLPNTLVVAVTPIILFLVGFWLLRSAVGLAKFLPASLVISGAISNYIDRLWFGVTIDYIRIFYSVINLADLMIVVGAIILLLKSPYRSHTPFHS